MILSELDCERLAKWRDLTLRRKELVLDCRAKGFGQYEIVSAVCHTYHGKTVINHVMKDDIGGVVR